MSAIHSRNTKPELLLRRALWHENCRYRVNCKDILGKPDIIIKKYKIAVFVDGDYWHGHNWALRGKFSLEEELKDYSPYWKAKILRNVERDFEVRIRLWDEGWLVFRFWESDIEKDIDNCVGVILSAIEQNKLKFKNRKR